MSGVASMSRARPSDGKHTARQAPHRRRAGSCRAASQWEQVHAACGRPPSCTVPSTRTKAPGDPEAASFPPPLRPFWRPSPEQLPAKNTAATRRARERRVKKAPKKEPDSIGTTPGSDDSIERDDGEPGGFQQAPREVPDCFRRHGAVPLHSLLVAPRGAATQRRRGESGSSGEALLPRSRQLCERETARPLDLLR